MEGTKMKILWMLTERGDRTYWTRIGVGYVNRDGSVNLTLDALPLASNKLQLRDYTARDAEADEMPPDGPPQTSGIVHVKSRRASEDQP
jgi:hypothetical protein